MVEANNNAVKKMVLKRSIGTGVIAGLLFSILYLVLYYFSFIKINPLTIFEVLFGEGEWINKWYAKLLFIMIISLLSMLFSLLYYATLKNIESWFAGVLFGVSAWCFLFVLIPLLFNNNQFLVNQTIHTNTTVFVLFLLYGLFVGYSISFDYKSLNIAAKK